MKINDTIPDFKAQAYHKGQFITVTQAEIKGK
jgi:alkyl hydroperoxide reductase subunit AhpC